MSKKSPKIAALIEQCRGHELPAHYLGYFECFNQQMFYEAHDVLEELWLTDRQGPNYGFYKGLIQFAGAFVHLQKNRLRPAAALFKLSRSYLEKYPSPYERLDVARVIELTRTWIELLEADGYVENPIHRCQPPTLGVR
jgi:predicted metal-dependent hydrolase